MSSRRHGAACPIFRALARLRGSSNVVGGTYARTVDVAIFHASVKTISRSKGHSAVAAAAYRAGASITDQRSGLTHDFTRKTGVLDARMVLPLCAPTWASDIASLWTAVEASETRKNSCVARDLVVGLPHELHPDARAALAHRIAADLVERYGIAVLVALHAPDRGGDARNFHAHLLMTTRALGPDGFGAKVRQLDDQKQGPREIQTVRALIADRTNAALERAGLSSRVDARSLRVQARAAAERGDLAGVAALVREPTRHEGRAATAASRRGESAAVVERNIAVRRGNAAFVAESRARATTLQANIDASKNEGPQVPRAARRTRAPKGSFAPAMRRVRVGNVARVGRAAGQDAELLNSQAEAAQQGMRQAREDTERYLVILARINRESVDAWRRYVAAFALSEAEGHHLLLELRKRPEGASVLQRAVKAWGRLDEAEGAHRQRRTQHGKAMARTARARAAVETHERTKPPAWRALTRRDWAEKRRAQRALLAEAERRETKVGAAVRRPRALDAARRAWETADTERRQWLPLPHEVVSPTAPSLGEPVELLPNEVPVLGPDQDTRRRPKPGTTAIRRRPRP